VGKGHSRKKNSTNRDTGEYMTWWWNRWVAQKEESWGRERKEAKIRIGCL
jgi:hypothetical protein